MAVRLNVILIQSPPPLPGAMQMSESLVGELIGRPGLDLTLIDRLDRITPGSTDRLTLESIAGDAAFLDWAPPEKSIAALAEIGFTGRRSPHTMDPSAVSGSANSALPSRRIYTFDLTNQTSEDVIAAIHALKSSREVRTFSLAAPSTVQQPKPVQTKRLESVDRESPNQSGAGQKTRSPLKSSSDVPISGAEPTSSDDHDDLDHLIDQLDDLDI